MSKRIVKRRKLKIGNLLIGLLVILGLSFCVYILLELQTKNIIIKNADYLNDDYIIDLAGVKDYPKFITLNRKNISSKLTESKYISKAQIKKKWGLILEINVTVNKALFYNTNNESYILNNNESIPVQENIEPFRVPRLLNYVPDKKYSKFLKGMSNIKEDILSKISDIEYKPNDYDKDRFLLYMDDGNTVYLTLTKFSMINHYNEVLSQLENHKGVLYLDNGNHFQIKE